MKVICIDDKQHSDSYYWLDGLIVEGEIYNVLREQLSFDNNGNERIGFILAEVPLKLRAAFNKDRFIPCSDIDETELIKERQSELV